MWSGAKLTLERLKLKIYIEISIVTIKKCRHIAKMQIDIDNEILKNTWLIQKEVRKNRKTKTEGPNKTNNDRPKFNHITT